MKPVIALVGRPNVGKSTLFNRLTLTRAALVADSPGLTRARNSGSAQLPGYLSPVFVPAVVAETFAQASDEGRNRATCTRCTVAGVAVESRHAGARVSGLTCTFYSLSATDAPSSNLSTRFVRWRLNSLRAAPPSPVSIDAG